MLSRVNWIKRGQILQKYVWVWSRKITDFIKNVFFSLQVKNALEEEKSTSSILRNELDIEANKFNSIQMELAEERANVNAAKIELDKEKASVDSLKIDIAQKEEALTEEKNHHDSTKR